MAMRRWGALAVLGAMRREVLPVVRAELERWRRRALALADPAARSLALDSIAAKGFHCEGGAVLSLCAPPGRARRRVVRAIVAVQTLSDFLDSWTDRGGEALAAGEVFARHAAFVAAAAALEPPGGAAPRGGAEAYARRLAQAAAAHLRGLPGLARARGHLLRLALRYAHMQALKHGPPAERALRLAAWHARLARRGGAAAALSWPEFGAAQGSTLAMFRLYAWAAAPQGDPPGEVVRRYVPAVTALHILLDAVVDEGEDGEGGDLSWWRSLGGEAPRRLRRLAAQARRRLRADPLAGVLVGGMVATYLAEAGARRLPLATRLRLWRLAGVRGWLFALALAHWRRRGWLQPRRRQEGAARQAAPDAAEATGTDAVPAPSPAAAADRLPP
jgi:tetraprenyl-beta-curcumene synthase